MALQIAGATVGRHLPVMDAGQRRFFLQNPELQKYLTQRRLAYSPSGLIFKDFLAIFEVGTIVALVFVFMIRIQKSSGF